MPHAPAPACSHAWRSPPSSWPMPRRFELAGLRGGLFAFAVGNAIIAVALLFIPAVATLNDHRMVAGERIGEPDPSA